MLHNIKKRKQDRSGFTIIEVLIVLAVAGLILLIVFLAVPALQRAARNTQRKNDVSAIGSAISNYIDNNGGNLPIQISDKGTNQLLVGTGAGNNFETAKLGFYTTAGTGAWSGSRDGNIFMIQPSSLPTFTTSTTAAPTATTITPNSVTIVLGYSCNSSNTNIGTSSPRSAAVMYAIETGSTSAALQCLEQ